MRHNSLIQKSLTSVLAVCAFVGTVGVVNAAFDLQSWKYSRTIETGGKTGIIKATFPKDMTWENHNFSDLRIIAGEGERDPQAMTEVPFAVTDILGTSYSTPRTVIVNPLNLGTQSDGSVVFVADTGNTGFVRTELAIETNSPNYRRQVSIYGADTLLPLGDTRWSLLNSSGYIFKFTDPNTGYTSGKNDIKFTANTSRYFKVVVSAGPEGPISVKEVVLFEKVSTIPPTYSEDKLLSVYNNPTKKATEAVIDMGVSGRLTQGVTLYPTDANYSRRVLIDVSDTNTATSSWRSVGQSSISHIVTPTFTGGSNTISYSRQNARFIRISIVNDDNPPLTLGTKVTVEGPLVTVFFEAKPGISYRAYYGNSNARTPQYDTSAFKSYIDETTLSSASVGAEVFNTVYVAPAGPVIPFSEAYPGLLNGFLVIIVLIIGALIFLYARKFIKKTTEGSDFTGGQSPTRPVSNPSDAPQANSTEVPDQFVK
jgi:hypothetical protein